MLQKIVKLACPEYYVRSYRVIARGCVNCNIEVTVDDEEQRLLLRIYLRDQGVVYRERALGVRLKGRLPVPLIYKIKEYDAYRFALMEFLPGITLSELLLSEMPHDVGAIMYDVGFLLAKIGECEFSKAGFFDKELTVIEGMSQEGYLKFAQKCLKVKR